MFPPTGTYAAIVIVDPGDADYGLLKRAVAELGIEVRHVRSGHAALRAAFSPGRQFWFVSARLPDMTGMELFRQLQPLLEGQPIAIIGDAYSPADEVEALSAGAALYLCKPLESISLAQWQECLTQSVLPFWPGS